MSYFMQDNEHHEYVCIDSMHEHARIFVINFFKFCILRILCDAILHKSRFGQAYRRYILKRIHTKFNLHFPNFM
jgi:hypothetical protein